MSLLKKLSIYLLMLFPIFAFGTSPNPPSAAEEKKFVVSAFKYYKNVSPSLTKTSVIEVPFSKESFSLPVFAVYNLTTSSFEPNLLSVNLSETASHIEASGSNGNPLLINDNNFATYLEFPLNGFSNRAEMTFYFDKLVTSSSLYLALDNYVALPRSVSITASVSGKDYIVLAPVRPSVGNIVFPKTTSSVWRVVFDYIQPLRISEMKFNDLSSGQITTRGLRFLAQPKQSYQVYFDADRYVQSTSKEAGDLFSNNGVIYSKATSSILNPEYVPVDSDGDTVPNLTDNCVSVSNADQKDEDANGLGDACEDYDRDGILNANDNCLDIPNTAQTDTDNDGIGDVCDDFENRATERMPWLPWVGIGLAGVVILGLFIVALKHKKEDTFFNRD